MKDNASVFVMGSVFCCVAFHCFLWGNICVSQIRKAAALESEILWFSKGVRNAAISANKKPKQNLSREGREINQDWKLPDVYSTRWQGYTVRWGQ